ncbi:hypothetical protein TcWFU_004891 [Taenia crassiceps]|uniref:Secreted protein n=1 Tax=Taenia crassiceps TaxID=6207 RepID=A0ABR4Q0S2_9CEST
MCLQIKEKAGAILVSHCCHGRTFGALSSWSALVYVAWLSRSVFAADWDVWRLSSLDTHPFRFGRFRL